MAEFYSTYYKGELTDEETLLFSLFYNIREKVLKKAELMLELYFLKRYNGDEEEIPDDEDYTKTIEFNKDIMVNIAGIWYRCNTTIEQKIIYKSEAQTYWNPGSSWTEYNDRYLINTVTIEKVKEVIYNNKINTKFKAMMNIRLSYS